MKRLILLLILTGSLFSQTRTTVTGLVQDSAGNVATSGTVVFTMQPQNQGVVYFVVGAGVIAPQSGTCGIDGTGHVKNLALSGACQVWGTDLIQPANLTYQVSLFPNGTFTNAIPQQCISGASYDLANPVFCPVIKPSPQFATVITSPIQNNLIPSVTRVFNIGSTLFKYANIFAANANIDNFPSGALFSSNVRLCTGCTLTFGDSADTGVSRSLFSPGTFMFGGPGFNDTSGTIQTSFFQGANGTVGGPTFSFLNDLTSGLYRIGASRVGLSLGGVNAVDFQTTKTDFANSINVTSGGYRIGNTATSGRYLKGDGTNFIQSLGAASGVGAPTACINQFVTQVTLNSDSAPTSVCASVTPSSASGSTSGSGSFVLQTGGTIVSPVVNGTPTGTGIPTYTLKKGTGAGNYTSASTTYVVVDSTNLCYTVTIPTGWKLSVTSAITIGSLTAAVNIVAALTDNGACGTANAGLLQETSVTGAATGAGVSANLGYVIVGDGASHTVALQFRTTNAADSVFISNSTATLVPTMNFILSPSN